MSRMTPSLSPPRLRRSLRVLPLTLLAVALAACSSDAPVTGRPSASAPVAPTVSATPTVSSAPSALVPADGTNVRSCRDGRCEVRVSARARVPLPARTGLGSVEVIAVDATAVTMVIPLIGSNFDSDGGCSPFITGPAAGSSGFVTLSCAAGDRGVLNKVTLEVPEIADGSAVLRVRS
jgi:hypothetical protein